MSERCGNTIHSDYVSDHRCQLPRGHVGDCLFGTPAAQLLVIAQDWRYSDEYVGNYFRGQYGRGPRPDYAPVHGFSATTNSLAAVPPNKETPDEPA